MLQLVSANLACNLWRVVACPHLWWSPADSASQIREDSLTRMCVYLTLQTRFSEFSAGSAPACLLKQVICIIRKSSLIPAQALAQLLIVCGFIYSATVLYKPSCLVRRGFPDAQFKGFTENNKIYEEFFSFHTTTLGFIVHPENQ